MSCKVQCKEGMCDGDRLALNPLLCCFTHTMPEAMPYHLEIEASARLHIEPNLMSSQVAD